MTAAPDTPPGKAAARRLTVDWSVYAQTVELTESARETGDVPATAPDRLVIDGLRTVDLERSTWYVACTGAGVATVSARVRSRDVRVVRDQSRLPRVFLDGVRILVPDSSVPDVTGAPAEDWVNLRFYARRLIITPAAATTGAS